MLNFPKVEAFLYL